MPLASGCCGITRRGFLLGAATGLAVGAPAAWLAGRWHPLLRELLPPFGSKPREEPQPEYAMPGRYPGRVVEVRHPHAVSASHRVNPDAVSAMIDRGMAELTGTEAGDVKAAWGTFFQPGEVIGIKVNPVGRAPKPGEQGRVANAVGSISSPAVLVKVVRCLQALGVRPQDIIVFERYANEFVDAGYAALVERELPGVRWYASAAEYSNEQVDIKGFDYGRDRYSPELTGHVAGYDPDVFTTMGFCLPEHSKRDDRRFRSHLSFIVSRMVDKVISIPVLKDHRSAGVTLALKNMSHGMNNNVARSHLGLQAHGFGPTSSHVFGPNQCNTFIPQAASQHRLRQKVALHLLDGLIGVYEGGPGCWNRTWATWPHQGLFFATDPVALDHVGWDVIDAKRAAEGWAPVERMGWVTEPPEAAVARALAALGGAGPLGSATLAEAARNRQEARGSEIFNLRQPDHVVLAGQLGLGTFERDEIDHRSIALPG
jgi:hypothetical protein